MYLWVPPYSKPSSHKHDIVAPNLAKTENCTIYFAFGFREPKHMFLNLISALKNNFHDVIIYGPHTGHQLLGITCVSLGKTHTHANILLIKSRLKMVWHKMIFNTFCQVRELILKSFVKIYFVDIGIVSNNDNGCSFSPHSQ